MTVRRVVNATWQWGGDTDLIQQVSEGADIVDVVEARTKDDEPVRIRRILRAVAWKVAQRTKTGALAGCALAVRRSSGVRLARWQSLKAAGAARGVQQRNLIHAVLITKTPTKIYEDHEIVVHNPLRSTGQQSDAVHAVRRRTSIVATRATTVRAKSAAKVRRAAGLPVRTRVVRWMVVGDFNQHHTAERAALGGAGSGGHDVMGAVWGTGWGDVKVTSRAMAHTDHHVLTIRTEENR